MATAPRQRIPRNLRILLGANFVSEVGSGLTLPFLLIYLHQVRHISLGVVGLLLAAASIVAIPVGPATGILVDKLGPRLVCSIAVGLSGAAAAALTRVEGPVSAAPVLVLYGLGQGATWPAFSALFAVTVHDPDLRPRVFARNFQLLNLGLGIGAVIAGFVVEVSQPQSFEVIYLIDAVTFFLMIPVLALLPARFFELAPQSADDTPAHPRGGYREVMADRRLRRYLVSLGLLAMAGYAAVSAGYVGYATTVVHVHPSLIAWAFAVNTALIVIVQPVALRVVGHIRRTTALCVCCGFFAAAWAVLILSGAFPSSRTGDVLVVAMFAVFALGEVMLAPVGMTLVASFARPALQGRYNAASTTVFNATNAIGPAFAGLMLAADLGNEYLLTLIVLCALAAVGFLWMRRILTVEIDNAQERARVAPTAVAH